MENIPPINSRPSKALSTSLLDNKLSFDRQILEEHNKYRKYHGAPPLVLSSALTEFASERAEVSLYSNIHRTIGLNDILFVLFLTATCSKQLNGTLQQKQIW